MMKNKAQYFALCMGFFALKIHLDAQPERQFDLRPNTVKNYNEINSVEIKKSFNEI